MIRMGEYDPFEHAERLGILVEYHPLRSAHGLWIPEERMILLKPRMRVMQERSVLAHEVAHATLGHRDDGPKNERQADMLAARRLIHPEALAAAARASNDAAEWCVELNVTPKMLRAYMTLQRLEEAS